MSDYLESIIGLVFLVLFLWKRKLFEPSTSGHTQSEIDELEEMWRKS